jgi:ppGpp synthetase/RelA/SpoT-type nucleotidyltranferase
MALDRETAQATYEARASKYARANTQISMLLGNLLADLGERYGVRDGFYVMGEPKAFDSFYRKATEKYHCGSVEEAFVAVRDLARVRVVCPTLDDCYALVELLKEQQAIYVDDAKVDDFIERPSRTGYRAIHLEAAIDVSLSGKMIGVPVEIQIRSALQEAWGHFTHADFYGADEVPELVGRLMRELSDLLYWADQHARILVKESTRGRMTPG